MPDEAPIHPLNEGVAAAAAREGVAAAGLAWELDMLEAFAAEALRNVRALTDRIEVAAKDAPAEELERLSNACAKQARAGRMAVLAHAKVIAEHEKRQQLKLLAARGDERAIALLEREREERVWERKQQLVRIVGRVADDEDRERDESRRIQAETAERLEHEDLYGHVMSRPMSELIAEICRDVGLTPDWTLLAQEAWAREEMAGDAPGEPLAGLAPLPPRAFTAGDPAAPAAATLRREARAASP